VLFQVLNAPVAIAVNVVTYAVSALFLGLIRTPEAPPAEEAPPEHFLADAMAGARAILAHPLVRPIAAMEIGSALFGSFFSALYSLFALRVLHVPPGLLGLTIALGGVGGVVGATLTPWLVRRVGAGRALAGLAVLGPLFNLAIPLAPVGAIGGAAALGFAQLFGDALLTGAFILVGSLRQSLLPQAVLGRASGAISAASGLAGICGALAGGALAEVFGARMVLFAGGLGILAAGTLPLLSPLRRYREPP
jgi:predicted MFS family arabinose efflux permease